MLGLGQSLEEAVVEKVVEEVVVVEILEEA